MFPGAGNSLDDSSRATWKQAEGVTAGGKASGWDVTAQPQQGTALPSQAERFISIVW